MNGTRRENRSCQRQGRHGKDHRGHEPGR